MRMQNRFTDTDLSSVYHDLYSHLGVITCTKLSQVQDNKEKEVRKVLEMAKMLNNTKDKVSLGSNSALPK